MNISENTTIQEVLELPAFKTWGKLLFPINRPIALNMTIKELSSSKIYLWYNYIDVNKTIEIINTLNQYFITFILKKNY